MSTLVSSPEQTLAFASQLAGSLSAGEVIALTGDLGAGKTHFVKGLALGLGCPADVSSPTFTLVHEYTGGRLPLYHADLYRLNSEEELPGIGLEELLQAGGVLAVEWADKFPDFFHGSTRWFHIHLLEGEQREIIERQTA